MEALAGGSLSARSTRSLLHQQKQMSPPLQPLEHSGSFLLTGVHALLFDDDALAAFVNSPAALLPWNGDPSLLIDRYDVRHLLQDLSGIRKRRPAPSLIDVTEQELNYERYRDLEGTHNSHHQPDSYQLVEEPPSTASGSYQAVPFSYSSGVTTCETATETSMKRTSFVPPFPVPEFLKSNLPDSEKLHQIIAGTAKFVTEHGGQSEFLLKVKQGDNPMFGFLNSDHHLHEYYRYLLQHRDLLHPVSQSRSVSVIAGEGLSLLGSAYGTGDDDNDEEGKQCAKDAEEESSNASPAPVDQGRVKESHGSTSIMKGTPVMATGSSRLLKGPETKLSKSGAKESGQHEKKLKSFVGAKDYTQPDKNILAQVNNSKVNSLPDKESKSLTGSRSSGRFEPRGTWQTVPNREYGMSVDAAAAAVFAATRGVRGVKQDSTFSRPASSVRTEVSEGSQAVSAPMDSRGLFVNDVNIAKATVQVTTTSETENSDALLTPAEKLKAERLRKAKMFAAMIKSGKCASEIETKLALSVTAIPVAGESLGNGGDTTRENVAGGQHLDRIHVKSKDTVDGHSSHKGSEKSTMEKTLGSVTSIEANHGSKGHEKSKKSHHRRRKHSRSDSEHDGSSRRKRSHHRGDRKHKHGKQKRQDSDSSDTDSGGNRSVCHDDNHDSSRSKKRHPGMEKHQSHGDRSHENNPSDSDRERKHKKRRSRDESASKDERKHRKHVARGQSDSEDGGKRREHRSRCKSDSEDKREHKKHRSSENNADTENGNQCGKHQGQFDSESEKKSRVLSESEGDIVVRKITDSRRRRNEQLPEKEDTQRASHSKADNRSSDHFGITMDVPADIRAKVREMLLSTL